MHVKRWKKEETRKRLTGVEYVRWIMSRNRADGPNQCIAWTGSHRVRNGIGSTVDFRQHLKRERGEEESLKLTLGSQSYA